MNILFLFASFSSAFALRLGRISDLESLREVYDSTSPDAVVGLALFDSGITFHVMKFVKSARMAGYSGQIILGVHPNFFNRSEDVQTFSLLGVTPKEVKVGPCQLPFEAPPSDYFLRKVCSADFPHLKMESARFALAAKWLEDCPICTGWVLQQDVSDAYFQRPPFNGMGRPKGDELIMVEEYGGEPHGIQTTHWFVRPAVQKCYDYTIEAHAMLCSGSIIGAKAQYVKFLQRYVEEFESNLKKGAQCDPNSIADQAVLNHLYYSGALASLHATSQEYGQGIVNTVGAVCSGNKELDESGNVLGHSNTDVLKLDESGYVLNNDGSVANVVHQDKVCWKNLVLPFLYPRYNN